MAKRVLCMLLTLIMVLGLIPASAFAAQEQTVLTSAVTGNDPKQPVPAGGATDGATEAPTDGATEAPTDGATEAPTDGATEAPAKPVTAKVLVSGQMQNAYLLPAGYLTVDSNLAESYKFTDTVDPKTAVSAMDVLVAANEAMAGKEAFAKAPADYMKESGGWVTMAFGNSGSMSFAVNGQCPNDGKLNEAYGAYTGYGVHQTAVKDEDQVVFFFYGDTNAWSDRYPVFYNMEGKAVSQVTANPGDTVKLQVKSYAFMMDGCKPEIPYTPLAKVSLMDKDSQPVEGTLTDEKGNMTLNIPEDLAPGTYYYGVCTAEENLYAAPGMLTVVVVPKVQSTLESLLIHTSFNPTKGSVLIQNGGDAFEAPVTFDPAVTEYTLPAGMASSSQLRFRAKPKYEGDKVILHYGENKTKDITWQSGSSKWENCLNAGKNVLKIEVVPAEGSNREAVTYVLSRDMQPVVSKLEVSSETGNIFWNQKFAGTKHAYILTVSEDVKSLTFEAQSRNDNAVFTYNGKTDATVALDKVNEIIVSCQADGVQNVFVLSINKAPAKTVHVTVTPADAILKVYDPDGKEVKANEDGSFTGLFGTADYTYIATKNGYKGVTGALNGEDLAVSLQKAPDSKLEQVDAFWPSFRGNESNMGITNVKTPIDPAAVELKWHQKLGKGWGAAPSVQIIVDDSLVVMSGKRLLKLDLQTGEILTEGAMVQAPNWGYTPPLYANGMIFCPLGNGTIQAFNAKTLESLWVYQDPMKGQSLSPIAYSDGYIYVGFWNQEVADANFVCLSVTDEDPAQTNEAKLATWRHTHKGGFYWAGALPVGNAIIVGTDDGVSEGEYGKSYLYAFDKKTGAVISQLELQDAGDQRSTIAYDKANNRVFFTTKSGFLGRANVDPVTGALSQLKLVRNQEEGQCTSTPVVYKGRVYYGTGMGFGNPSKLMVADAESLKLLYSLDVKAYPQCSVMISTAYEQETGFIYVYTTYNGMPGGITMAKVDPNATTAEKAEVIELYDAKGFEQYCICSVICGPDGTLYYKNDSAQVLAVADKNAPAPSDPTTPPTEAATDPTTPPTEEATDPAVPSDGWNQDDKGWFYVKDGETVKNDWVLDSGKYSYMDENGYMLTGWQKIGNFRFHFDDSGFMQIGWHNIDGKRYLFDGHGHMQTGWQWRDGFWYLFDGSGRMQTGWQWRDGYWYLFDRHGHMQEGWQWRDGYWYLFDRYGHMQTGWQWRDGYWYLFDGHGHMQEGWQWRDGRWYFFDGSGHLVKTA